MRLNEERLLELAEAMGQVGLFLRDARHREKDARIFNFSLRLSLHMGTGKAWVLNLLKYAKNPEAKTLETGFAKPTEAFLLMEDGMLTFDGTTINWKTASIHKKISWLASFMNQVFIAIDAAVEGNIYAQHTLPRKAQLSADNVFTHIHEGMIILEHIRDVLTLKGRVKRPLTDVIEGKNKETP